MNKLHAEPRQFRKHYRTNRLRNAKKRAEKFARWRKRKEALRIERLQAEPVMPDMSHCPSLISKRKRSGFRVTVVCMDDGERVSFTATRSSAGELSVSPTRAGRKVSAVLQNYKPLSTYK